MSVFEGWFVEIFCAGKGEEVRGTVENSHGFSASMVETFLFGGCGFNPYTVRGVLHITGRGPLCRRFRFLIYDKFM